MSPSRKYLDLATVAEYLGISEKSARQRIAEGSLPAYRMGPRNIRVLQTDVDKLLVHIPTGGAASGDQLAAASRDAPVVASVARFTTVPIRIRPPLG